MPNKHFQDFAVAKTFSFQKRNCTQLLSNDTENTETTKAIATSHCLFIKLTDFHSSIFCTTGTTYLYHVRRNMFIHWTDIHTHTPLNLPHTSYNTLIFGYIMCHTSNTCVTTSNTSSCTVKRQALSCSTNFKLQRLTGELHYCKQSILG